MPQDVNLTKESKREIVDALRDIRKSIIHQEKQTQTFSENVADAVTSGKGFLGAIREALKIEHHKESNRMRRNLDPLNIVNRMTGGSRMATVLAGKTLGRSNDDIRNAIGMSTNGTASPVSASPSMESSATPLQSDQSVSVSLLEQIAKALGLITFRVTEIARKIGATKVASVTKEGRLRDKVSGQFMSAAEAKDLDLQTKLLMSIRDTLLGQRKDDKVRADQQADALRAAKARPNQTTAPTQVRLNGTAVPTAAKPAPAEQGLFGSLIGSFSKLEGVLVGFAAAVAASFVPLEKFKGVVSASIEGVGAAFNSMRSIVSTVPEALSNVISKAQELIKAPEGLKDLASKAIGAGTRITQKLLPGKAAEAAAKAAPEAAVKATVPAAEALTKAAPEVAAKSAVPAAEAAAKTATKAAEAVATEAPKAAAKKSVATIGKDKLKKILAKQLPKAFGGGTLARVIPGIGAALGLGFAVSRLIKGDLVGAGLEAVSGLGSAATAVPSIVANLVRDVYNEAYGLFPERDPLRSERLPELAKTVEESVSDWLTSKAHAEERENKQAKGVPPPAVQTRPAPVTPPSAVTTPSNSTAATIAQAQTQSKTLQQGPMPSPNIPPQVNINNITNQKSHTALGNMIPSPRSSESSYIRTVDENSDY